MTGAVTQAVTRAVTRAGSAAGDVVAGYRGRARGGPPGGVVRALLQRAPGQLTERAMSPSWPRWMSGDVTRRRGRLRW